MNPSPLSLRRHDKVVSGSEGNKPSQNGVSNLRFLAQLKAYDGLDRSQFVSQAVCEFLDGQLAEFLFLLEPLH